MSTAAKRKPPAPPIPTLAERATCLFEEIMDSSAGEQRSILLGLRDMLDAALDDIAEARRCKTEPGAIPVGWVRQQLDNKGYGACHCKAMAEALKDA
jgi:hypothetical protein